MELRAGTSGFSYKGWVGPFYPEGLPAKRMLGFYAEQLPAVEINNTFYRMPRASVLAAWAQQVPEGFRFAIKASRRITHFKRLADAGEETGYLLRSCASLGERLGALLFQLPPKLKLDLPRLEAFLELLPEGLPAAFEFRHPSWSDPAVTELLRGRSCARVAVDSDGEEAPELERTGSLLYLRLRRAGYGASELRAWGRRVRAAGVERALVFFKHEDAGAGPRLASRFLELAGGARVRRRPQAARRSAGQREVG